MTRLDDIGPLFIDTMKREGVQSKELAEYLGVTPPNVSQMLKRLREDVGVVKVSSVIELFGALGYDIEVSLVPNDGRTTLTVEAGASFS